MAAIMKVAAAAAVLILVPCQDTSEKAVEKLLELMDKGAFVEGRGLANQICQKFPKTPAAETALPYTRDNALLSVVPMEVNGPSRNRIDLVVMADGLEYDNRAQDRWKKEVELIFKAFFESETLKEYAKYFNTYRAHIASKTEKLNKPDGPVLTFFKSRDDDGEILTDGFAARDVAAYSGSKDRLALVQVRPAGLLHGISGRGVATFGSPRPTSQAILHAFGHGLAGLADESPSLKVYGGMEKKKKEQPPVPVACNISETRDPLKIPWAHWMKAKEDGDKRAAKIDIHEGGAFRAMKVWRPVDESLCVMNDGMDFCPVCRENIVLLLYSYVRPIDAALPCDKILTVEGKNSLDLWVRPMAPASHRLTVGWITEPAWPGDKGGSDAEGRAGDEGILQKALRCDDGQPGWRNGEGPAWRIPKGDMADGVSQKGADGVREVLTINEARLGAGRHRITCVVRDNTEWVIKDSQNLLVDWRTWIVEIK
jgi:hypothetical protein